MSFNYSFTINKFAGSIHSFMLLVSVLNLEQGNFTHKNGNFTFIVTFIYQATRQ